MFNTIVWATDGSPSAAKALPLAKSLATRTAAKLVIVHVEEILTGPAAVLNDKTDALFAQLEGMVGQLEREGIDAAVSWARAPSSRAAATIVDLTTEAGADLIVAATRGHGPIAGLALGSVAHGLLRLASCPVLFVPVQTGPEN